MIVILSGYWSSCIPKFQKMYGTGSGQHWSLGFGEATPLNSNSPYFLTVSAAQGFKMDNRRRRACGV
jgi:hypothetical protein